MEILPHDNEWRGNFNIYKPSVMIIVYIHTYTNSTTTTTFAIWSTEPLPPLASDIKEKSHTCWVYQVRILTSLYTDVTQQSR